MKKPLRLLITTPNLDTAGSKYIIADLVETLDRSMIRPSLCVHRATDTALERTVRAGVDDFWELPLPMATRPVRQLLRQTRAIARQLRGRYDVAQSFDYASAWSEGLIMKQARIPWVIDKTNMNWGNRSGWIRSLLATRIVCKSHTQYAALFEGTILSKRATVIHNGIKLSRFEKKGDPEAVLQTLPVPPGNLLLGCVAHLVPAKGHVELLHAFARIAEKYLHTYLVLVGTGEPVYIGTLHALVEEVGLADRVLFLGSRDDVPCPLHQFDAFILPTRNRGRKEAFGVALVEAMACRLPVIATKSGGPEDIVVPQETGWLVEADGIEPLVEAMDELLADEERRQRFGQTGKERAVRLFSRERMVQRYQQLYLEVA